MVESEFAAVGKIDVQILVQNLAQAQRDLLEERREKTKAVNSERERARWEIERSKKESDEKLRSIEKENEALVRALGRAHQELDVLRLENATMKATPKPEIVQDTKVEKPPTPEVQMSQANWRGAGGPMLPKVSIAPPGTPSLGPVRMPPTPLAGEI